VIAHIVTFTWKKGTDPEEEVAELGGRLQIMAAGIPSIVFYRAGANLRLRPNGADFAVIAVVHDQAGLDRYLDAPAHLDVVAQGIAPHLGTRQAVQLDLGSDIPAEWL